MGVFAQALPEVALRGAWAQGHRGRGIWQCALLGGLLLTGGADSSVKCWYLPDWLPPPALAALGTTPPARCSSSTAADAAPGASWVGLGESFELLVDLPAPAGCAVGAVAAAWHGSTAGAAPGALQPPKGPCSAQSSGASAAQQAQQAPAPAAPPGAGGTGTAAAGHEGGSEGSTKRKKGRKGVPSDSKAEWVRSMAMAGLSVLYVATNRGLIHRVLLPSEPLDPSAPF